MQPLLLIDVDGPLSPFGAPWFPDGGQELGYEAHELTTLAGENYTVALRRDHGCWLRELSESYALAWATTWNQEANRLISPILGLPDDLPIVPLPEHATPWAPQRTWKSDFVAQWCAGRDFAWLDDEIDDATCEWLDRQPSVGRHLALPVPAERGLTEADLDALRGFVT